MKKEKIMEKVVRSPRIKDISWGKIIVEGQTHPYKDARVYPGGCEEWDWNETGTHHVPGIQIADIQKLIDHGVNKVILSKGYYERLQVCPETLELLKSKGIETFVEETGKAADHYNKLCETEAVGALFHSTC